MTDFPAIRKRLQWLRGEDGVVKPPEAERVMTEVLRPLLELDGYTVLEHPKAAVDWVARRLPTGSQPGVSIGLEYKHYESGRPLERRAVESLLDTAINESFDRLLLIARHGFASASRELAETESPVALELLSLDDVAVWVDRVESQTDAELDRIQIIVRTAAHEMAMAIAQNPGLLSHIEWRDLERMIGRIFEGLGFTATVTPSAKDGGKDVVLECRLQNGDRSYIVEIKHWVSGKKVGRDVVDEFVKVVGTEERHGGVLISTSGFGRDAFSSLTQITRERVRFGRSWKVHTMAKRYERASFGLWSPPGNLEDLLFEHTE